MKLKKHPKCTEHSLMATERERGGKRTQINCVSTWDQTKSVYTLSFTVHCNFLFSYDSTCFSSLFCCSRDGVSLNDVRQVIVIDLLIHHWNLILAMKCGNWYQTRLYISYMVIVGLFEIVMILLRQNEAVCL